MKEASTPTKTHIPSQVLSFHCSGDDRGLRDLITHTLRESSWISVDKSRLRIDWRTFLEELAKSPSDGKGLTGRINKTLLKHLEEMGETVELGLFASGQLKDQIPTGSNEHLKGLVITRQSANLSSPYVSWFESFKDLAERLLYEWDEALKLKTSSSRSQHMHHRIVPGVREAQRVAGSTQYAILKRVIYPLSARLRLGAALPKEIEEITRVTANKPGEKGAFLPLMQAYAQSMQALHQAWTHLRESSKTSAHSQSKMWVSHPAFRNLVAKNQTLSSLIFQRSVYGCDLGGSPLRAEGFSRIDKSQSLLDCDHRPTKRLPIDWPFPAERVLHHMCQALRDFCTYFYSYDPSDGSHARRVLDQIICIEGAIPHPKFVDVETPEFYEGESLSLEPDFLTVLDHTIECLLQKSPLLVSLATGMLCTYEMPSAGEWGFALGPQLIAAILTERGLEGALPFQYVRPQGLDSFQLTVTSTEG